MTEIRVAETSDISRLSELELLCFSIPWSEESLRTFVTDPERRRCFVCEDRTYNPAIIGYIGIQFVCDEAEIANLAVHPDRRNEGVGRVLLDEAKRFCIENGIKVLHLEVRSGNDAAIGLYERFGFLRSGRRKGYYADSGEDALLYSLMITVETEPGMAPEE
jgi:ribosomal-protein-alanine N-acetyltransferase